MKSTFLIILVLCATISGFTVAYAQPSLHAQEARALKQLKALPDKAAPALRVNDLVVRLVALKPLKSYRYFKIGIARLPDFAARKKLARKVIKAAIIANLSTRDIAKLDGRIYLLLYGGDPIYVPNPVPM